jgi:hypothetical protein
MPEDSDIEIRPVYELEDFGDAYSGDAREVHDRVRERLGKRG